MAHRPGLQITDATAFDAEFAFMSRRLSLARSTLVFVGVTVPFWLAAAGLAVVTVLILAPGLYLVPVGAGLVVGAACAWRYPGMPAASLGAVAAVGSLPQALATVGILAGLATLDASFTGSAAWRWIVLSFPLSAPLAGAAAVLLANATTRRLTGRA